jgi:hypothetical protein
MGAEIFERYPEGIFVVNVADYFAAFLQEVSLLFLE